MNKYRTLAANTALMSAGTFGSKLLVFLMVRFYTGCLTPAEYGTADLITQTANLLIPVVSLDIPEGVFRFAADRQSDRADAFSAGVRTVTLGSAALLPGVPGVPEYGALLAAFVIASCYHALCAQFVRAKGDTVLFAVQGLLNTALFIGLNVLFLAGFRWGIRGYVLSTTAANVLTAAFLVGKARLWRELRLRPARGLQRQMLRYCVPLIPTAVFWWIMGVSDRYMVKWFLGSVYVVTKKSAASFRTSLAGAGLNVALNLWLIPRLGIQGAAAATFAGCLAVFFLRLVSARRLLPFPLSGGRLALGAGALLVQTAFLLLRWSGWRLAQGIGLFAILLLGFPAMRSTLRVIFHRKQADR